MSTESPASSARNLHRPAPSPHLIEKQKSRSDPVSQILSIPLQGLCDHFSHGANSVPRLLRGAVRLIPGDPASRQPFPCLSCIAWGLPCLPRCLGSGELLPPRFALTCTPKSHRRFIFCGTFRPASLGNPPSPAFTGHAALRCPDFPLPTQRPQRSPGSERRPESTPLSPRCPDQNRNIRRTTAYFSPSSCCRIRDTPHPPASRFTLKTPHP